MPRDARKALIHQIEEERGSRVLAYVTGDRAPATAQIGDDAVRPMYAHLREMGHVRKLDLFIYSRGETRSNAPGRDPGKIPGAHLYHPRSARCAPPQPLGQGRANTTGASASYVTSGSWLPVGRLIAAQAPRGTFATGGLPPTGVGQRPHLFARPGFSVLIWSLCGHRR